MKALLFAALLFSQPLIAATVSVISPCQEHVSFSEEIFPSEEITIGDLTLTGFENMEIDYIGNAHGMNSILNTPTGLESMEILSDEEMMAYGWCFSINGQSPALYADEIKAHESDEVLWWYGYAHYKAGQWLTMCTPSYLRQDSNFCQGILNHD